MRKLWTTKELMTYYNKTENDIKRWRKDGLKNTMLSGAYYYDYSDIVEYLSE